MPNTATLISLLLLSSTASAWAKTHRNFYTAERLQWTRDNLAHRGWAQKERGNIVARADAWADYDDEELLRLVPALEVARCNTVHAKGCPVHGEEILKRPGGIKSWRMSFDKPYQVHCPVGEEWYPSNDFWAYLQGGCSATEGEQTSEDMIWVMTGPDEVKLYTDTSLPDALVNLFHRDGGSLSWR